MLLLKLSMCVDAHIHIYIKSVNKKGAPKELPSSQLQAVSLEPSGHTLMPARLEEQVELPRHPSPHLQGVTPLPPTATAPAPSAGKGREGTAPTSGS